MSRRDAKRSAEREVERRAESVALRLSPTLTRALLDLVHFGALPICSPGQAGALEAYATPATAAAMELCRFGRIAGPEGCRGVIVLAEGVRVAAALARAEIAEERRVRRNLKTHKG